MFNIGDTVWMAQTRSVEKYVTCNDCFGKRFLTVILGDGEEVTVPCEGCTNGYNGPRGVNIYFEQEPKVLSGKIKGIEVSTEGVEYKIAEGDSEYSSWCLKEENTFASQAEAEIRAVALAEQISREARDRVKNKERNYKSWAWHVTYYRGIIKKARVEIARAEFNLAYAQKVAKEEKNVTVV
jgi:hypothetical protein